jgi:apolipoprotein D and lipocalin family protein
MQTRSIVAVVLSLCVAACGSVASGQAPLKSVDRLDVSRYMGTWYEVAKYPNWFQRNCARETKATYSLVSADHVTVDNSCLDKAGERQEAIGVARPAASARSAELQVRFAPDWLSFLPMLWADYWVVDIDPTYQLVAVSEPGRRYLWILARTPQVDAQAYAALLGRLKLQGFDLGKLERTPQSP